MLNAKKALFSVMLLFICIDMSFGHFNNPAGEKAHPNGLIAHREEKPLMMAVVEAFIRYHDLLKHQKFLISTKQKIALHNYKVLQSVLDNYLVENSINAQKLMELIPLKMK